MTTTRTPLITLAAVGAMTAAILAGSQPSTSAGQLRASTTPVFDPAHFTHPVGNPYYPLTPGLVTRMRGVDEGERLIEVVRVTHRAKTILGVRTTVIRDVVRRSDHSLEEKTTDWYANDDQGNVWYLGEKTATYDEHGNVESRDGSWEAGVDGAVPGVLMPADAGSSSSATRPEFAPGAAEDQSWFVQHLGHVRTPAGRFDDVVRSFEWTRLEPGVISMKFYAAGIGIVAERDVAGGKERLWLVRHHR
jgi:hypothetical protein